MVIYRSSDSLSRCGSNDFSLYDARKCSALKTSSSLSSGSIHRDTIEISRDKLKEDALNRLRHKTQYGIAYQGFMRIGKYLFLAVAMPPYFLIYGLPKWVLVEAIPLFFSFSLQIIKKIHSQSEKTIERLRQTVISPFRFLKNLTQVVLHPLIKIALQIGVTYRRLRETIRRKIKAKMTSIFTLPFATMRRRGFFSRLMRPVIEIKGKVFKAREKLRLLFETANRLVKESPQIVLSWGEFQFQRLRESAFSLNTKWKHALLPSQKRAEKGVKWIDAQLKKGGRILKQQLIPLMNLYWRHCLPLKQRMNRYWKTGRGQALDFFHNQHQRAFRFLQSCQRIMKGVSSDRVCHSLISNLLHFKWPPFLKKMLRKLFSSSLFGKILNAGVKGGLVITTILLEGAIVIWQLLARMRVFFKNFTPFLRLAFKRGSQGMERGLKMALTFMKQSIFHLVYYLLLWSAIFCILFGWGLQLLSECTADCFSRFLVFKSNRG
ncbi:MAG: hypothetical protein ACH350_07815 [Parachlamydiaceae bacterium]